VSVGEVLVAWRDGEEAGGAAEQERGSNAA